MGTPEQAPSRARRVSVIFPSLPVGHTASQPTGHHSHASITILLPSAGFLLLTEPPAALSTQLTMKTLFGNDTNMPQLLRGAVSQLAGCFPKPLHFQTLPRRQPKHTQRAAAGGTGTEQASPEHAILPNITETEGMGEKRAREGQPARPAAAVSMGPEALTLRPQVSFPSSLPSPNIRFMAWED